MIEHNRTHTGERPYSCKVCSAKFISKTYLRRHQRKHDNEIVLQHQLPVENESTDAPVQQCPEQLPNTEVVHVQELPLFLNGARVLHDGKYVYENEVQIAVLQNDDNVGSTHQIYHNNATVETDTGDVTQNAGQIQIMYSEPVHWQQQMIVDGGGVQNVEQSGELNSEQDIEQRSDQIVEQRGDQNVEHVVVQSVEHGTQIVSQSSEHGAEQLIEQTNARTSTS